MFLTNFCIIGTNKTYRDPSGEVRTRQGRPSLCLAKSHTAQVVVSVMDLFGQPLGRASWGTPGLIQSCFEHGGIVSVPNVRIGSEIPALLWPFTPVHDGSPTSSLDLDVPHVAAQLYCDRTIRNNVYSGDGACCLTPSSNL